MVLPSGIDLWKKSVLSIEPTLFLPRCIFPPPPTYPFSACCAPHYNICPHGCTSTSYAPARFFGQLCSRTANLGSNSIGQSNPVKQWRSTRLLEISGGCQRNRKQLLLDVTYALQLASGESDTPDAEAASVSMTRPLTQLLF
jgi:hypothetical protein